MNWFSPIGKQASRLASLELFRYIRPGFFVTIGFLDPGNGVTNVRIGMLITLLGALAASMLLSDPFKGMLWSLALSLQLPLTIIPLILLTSSKKIMGIYANKRFGAVAPWIVGMTEYCFIG